jgi:7,8-dihydropterin-6-yl-methyl-4-(beta-D-ribofuranosyl)aminobenzene 5'-phosphate synthase
MRIWFFLLLCASLSAASPELRLTIVYDNTSIRPDLPSDWGFSALVDFRGQRILFDQGAKPGLFQQNLKALGIDPSSIQKTLISHQHPNHSGAMYRALPSGLIDFMDGLSRPHLAPPAQLGPGIYTTGEISGSPPEQALVIETSQGIVMLVSCAHPGIVRMVETVEKQRNVGSIRLLVGGLHMFEQPEQQIRPAVTRLQQLNVQSVALGHCTGDLALRLFHQAYGDHFTTTAAGKHIDLN